MLGFARIYAGQPSPATCGVNVPVFADWKTTHYMWLGYAKHWQKFFGETVVFTIYFLFQLRPVWKDQGKLGRFRQVWEDRGKPYQVCLARCGRAVANITNATTVFTMVCCQPLY